jgi:hypothetical protein
MKKHIAAFGSLLAAAALVPVTHAAAQGRFSRAEWSAFCEVQSSSAAAIAMMRDAGVPLEEALKVARNARSADGLRSLNADQLAGLVYGPLSGRTPDRVAELAKAGCMLHAQAGNPAIGR